MILGVVLTLPLDVVFIPWAEDHYDNGAIGGALSYVATEVMMLVAALWKLAPGLVSKRTLVRFVKTVVAGGAMFAACWPLARAVAPTHHRRRGGRVSPGPRRDAPVRRDRAQPHRSSAVEVAATPAPRVTRRRTARAGR